MCSNSAFRATGMSSYMYLVSSLEYRRSAIKAHMYRYRYQNAKILEDQHVLIVLHVPVHVDLS